MSIKHGGPELKTREDRLWYWAISCNENDDSTPDGDSPSPWDKYFAEAHYFEVANSVLDRAVLERQ
jgi:hypothetical protein